MLPLPKTDSIGDKLIKIIVDNFPDGLSLDEGLGLVNTLHEHRVSILKDTMSNKTLKLGLTMNMIAELSAYLVDRYLSQRNELPVEGITRNNFLFKFSDNFEIVESVRARLLENPFIDKIEPYGSGVFNLTDIALTN